MNDLTRRKLLDGIDALHWDDLTGYALAIVYLQCYAKEYGSRQAMMVLDSVCEEWGRTRGRCPYCGERGVYHDPRG